MCPFAVAPVEVDHLIARDPHQPGRERHLAPLVAWQAVEHLEEDLLGDVFGVVDVAQSGQRVAVDLVDVRVVQRPDRIEVAAAAGPAAAASGKQPDLDRPKEPLEAFTLESIQMVGSLTQGRETYGLVKAGPNLDRVRKGNYMGQNFGVITGIDEAQISLKELIQEGSGEWIERSSSLQLQEVKK
jgi:hypothetical protein